MADDRELWERICYWPGEGLYLISAAPFKGAVEGRVNVSQVEFSLEGQDYTLLTAVPITRSEHVWVKHEAGYLPSKRRLGADDSNGFLGGESSNEFPK